MQSIIVFSSISKLSVLLHEEAFTSVKLINFYINITIKEEWMKSESQWVHVVFVKHMYTLKSVM